MHKIYLLKKCSTYIIAICVLVIPFFQCICCEYEKENFQNCCDSSNSDVGSMDLHPCLDSFKGMEFSENSTHHKYHPFSRSLHPFEGFINSSKFYWINEKNRFFCPSVRRHLFLSIILIWFRSNQFSPLWVFNHMNFY